MEKTEGYVHEAREPRVYEVGFHFIPKLAEGDIPAEVEKIKKVLSANGASVIEEEAPRMIQLTYPMARAAAGRREKFSQAWFGWIKFEVAPEAVVTIADEVKRIETVLRHLVISTVRESTLSKKVFVADISGETIKKPAKVEGVKLSDAEIETAVDELVSGAAEPEATA